VDKFLEDAIEVDVDAVADGDRCVVAGIMEHIEEAGIHSATARASCPPHADGRHHPDGEEEHARARDGTGRQGGSSTYSTRCATTWCTCSRSTRAEPDRAIREQGDGRSWAKIATKVMIGRTLKQLGIEKEVVIDHIRGQEAVFPFNRFPASIPCSGPR